MEGGLKTMAKKLKLQQATPPTEEETLAEARAWLTHVHEEIRFLFELSIDIAEKRGVEIWRLKATPRYCEVQEAYGYPCEAA